MSKEHCITVTIASTSGDAINQEVILREYATTAEELVEKNFGWGAGEEAWVLEHVIHPGDTAARFRLRLAMR